MEISKGRETRNLIVKTARQWIGTPYQHQASKINVGCDCLGLVRGVWAQLYGNEPEEAPSYSPDWAEAGAGETMYKVASKYMQENSINKLNDMPLYNVGDLLLFRWRSHLPAKHCAIVSYDNKIIHSHDGASVCEVHLSNWWLRHMAYAFEFPRI